jgi:hypothetical protein
MALPLGWAAWSALRNRFVIVNESGQAIRWLTVVVCGKSYRFVDIETNGQVSAQFGTPRDESLFKVNGQFADSVEFNDFCGYVVWEDYGQQFRLTIKPDGELNLS